MNTTRIENEHGIVYIAAIGDTHMYTIGVERWEDKWSYQLTIGNMSVKEVGYDSKESAFEDAEVTAWLLQMEGSEVWKQ